MTAPPPTEPFPGTYRETVSFHPRAAARSVALDLLGAAWTASGRMQRGLARPRVHFLCLHHLFADEEAPFRALLSSLARGHEFLGYSEAVRRIRAGEFPRPAIAFSFDDGFRTNLAAARILEEFGASAAFFLCPSIVGETNPAAAAAFCRDRLLTGPREFLGWADVETLQKGGHEIGAHTVTHPCLAEAPPASYAGEIGGSRRALEAKVGPVRHFAWPFGHFSEMCAGAARAVFDAGFETCASAERGCHVTAPSTPRFCLRRESVVAAWPGRHIRFFLARSAARADAAGNGWPWPL